MMDLRIGRPEMRPNHDNDDNDDKHYPPFFL